MTHHSAVLAAAFPGCPIAVLLLMERGDLSRVLPDWLGRFEVAFDELSSAHRTETRLMLAWRTVLAEYDERSEAMADRG
jgi:hypothetical protein